MQSRVGIGVFDPTVTHGAFITWLFNFDLIPKGRGFSLQSSQYNRWEVSQLSNKKYLEQTEHHLKCLWLLASKTILENVKKAATTSF